MGVAKCDHTHSVGVQTEGREGDGTVAERLRELDEQHRAQLARGQEEEEREGGRGTEQCRRETEEQLREEMEREVQKFRYIFLLFQECQCVLCVYPERVSWQR